MKILKAKIDHLEDVLELFNAYRVFYKQEAKPLKAKNFLRRRLQAGESHIFIAYLNDKPVGFTQLYPSFSSVAMERIFVLNDLFVSEESRKRGVAEALMKTAAEFAKSQNAIRLCLETAKDNIPGQSLYEKLGWVKGDDFFSYSLKI